MPPACFARLRTAALAAAPLFPATAFIGGCNGNGKSAAAAAANVFANRSRKRVEAHAAMMNDEAETPMAPHERLAEWPMTVLDDVRDFFGADHAWQPCEVEALRTEAAAMRVLALEANAELGGTAFGGVALESTAATWPGVAAWPGTDGWPGSNSPGASRLVWPKGAATDLWQLRAFEIVHCGLLKTNLVEEDSPYTPTPRTVVELRLVTTELWSRRKCRLDQLALRRDGAFGKLLPAATVATCDKLIKMELADVEQARSLVGRRHYDRDGAVQGPSGSLKSLRKFVETGSLTADRLRETREHVVNIEQSKH